MRYVLDQDLSQQIAVDMECEDGQCYFNAYHAQALVPDALYVEGFAVSPRFPFPINHSWLEIEGTNNVVDPTPVWSSRANNGYFPVFRYTQEEALEVPDGTTLPLNETAFMLVRPEARQAYVDACRFSLGREQGDLMLSMHPWFRAEEYP